jgi:uncharacterized membrane protein YeaQ/YmgE (transglycosylase-associated protein family)
MIHRSVLSRKAGFTAAMSTFAPWGESNETSSFNSPKCVHFFQKVASKRGRRKHGMGHSVLAWIIIGVIAGWLTGKLMKGSGFGFIMDMVVGLIGALVGGFVSSHLGFGTTGEHGMVGSIIIAVIGAVLLTVILRLITGNRSRNL